MTTLPEHHAHALEATRVIVASIGDDQWSLPTPNDGWDVRYVVNHLTSGNYWVAEFAAGETIESVGERLDGDLLGSDPLDAYRKSAQAADAAFRVPGAMDAPFPVSYGPVPGSVYAGHRLIEALIHGWDLAVATSQSTVLDDELVAATLEVVEPQAELLAGSGAFGTKVEVPDAASPQTVLLAYLGRRG